MSDEQKIEFTVVGPIEKATADGPPPTFVDRECGVCWASHQCGLPPRHDGDHGCIDEDDDGEPHAACPRVGPDPDQGDAWGLYSLDLLRFDDFCDLCGPIPPVTEHIHGILDHAMRTHPDRWAEDGYAEDYARYLGDGQWQDRSYPPVKTGDPKPVSNKADALVSPREDVIARTVAAIREADIPVGPWGLRVMSVPGMPVSVGPDARPFEVAVRARLGDRYTFGLVGPGSAMVTRLAEEQP